MAQREQLNLRLPPETFAILEAAAYLESLSVPEYVKDMVERHVTSLREDEAIQLVHRTKVERAAVKSGRVARLEDRRGSKGA